MNQILTRDERGKIIIVEIDGEHIFIDDMERKFVLDNPVSANGIRQVQLHYGVLFCSHGCEIFTINIVSREVQRNYIAAGFDIERFWLHGGYAATKVNGTVSVFGNGKNIFNVKVRQRTKVVLESTITIIEDTDEDYWISTFNYDGHQVSIMPVNVNHSNIDVYGYQILKINPDNVILDIDTGDLDENRYVAQFTFAAYHCDTGAPNIYFLEIISKNPWQFKIKKFDCGNPRIMARVLSFTILMPQDFHRFELFANAVVAYYYVGETLQRQICKFRA